MRAERVERRILCAEERGDAVVHAWPASLLIRSRSFTRSACPSSLPPAPLSPLRRRVLGLAGYIGTTFRRSRLRIALSRANHFGDLRDQLGQRHYPVTASLVRHEPYQV